MPCNPVPLIVILVSVTGMIPSVPLLLTVFEMTGVAPGTNPEFRNDAATATNDDENHDHDAVVDVASDGLL